MCPLFIRLPLLLLSSPPLFAPSLPVRLVALQLSLLKESSSKEVINLEPKAVSKFVEEQPFIEASGSSLIVDLLLCFSCCDCSMISISGASVMISVSGASVMISVSGASDMISVSGASVMISVSGASVMFSVSGASVMISVSGASVMFSVSGASVMISVSGASVMISVSGASVMISVSGDQWYNWY